MSTKSTFGIQLHLPFDRPHRQSVTGEQPDIERNLRRLLEQDLTFKGERTGYATHNLHAFAAKFPPQLPRLFIDQLTRPGEWVLDPMMGSGTTLVEAVLNNRHAVGVDLDPLATMISYVKSAPPDLSIYAQAGVEMLHKAKHGLSSDENVLANFYSPQAIEFFHYWFEEHTIAELYAVAHAIRAVEDVSARAFLQVVFSSIIITKSGGLTRARDLAHSRPHRDLTKQVKQNAFDVFEERLQFSLELLESITHSAGRSVVVRADARTLPLQDNSVDLIFTSPPYAANAIDYMRAHKFALIWFGYKLKELSDLRSQYIGAELQAADRSFASDTANTVLSQIACEDESRAAVIAHYFRDMESTLRDMLRVLVEGRAAVLVVGSSIIRGVDIKAPTVLAELAGSLGFRVIGISKREIVRNARMMPTSHNSARIGIEARMHEEGVIGLIKPAKE